jgi:hypothetical protein
MRLLLPNDSPLPALGMASLVLGVIALLLSFLPVLGLPISACGLLCGLLGFAAALVSPGTSLRWSVGGLAVGVLALSVNLALAYAPTGYLPDPHVPKTWQPVPDRPSVPPPARHFDGW